MDTKRFFKSKTIWGIVIAALPTILNLFGIALPPGLAEVITTALVGAGSGLGIYGRIAATQRLSV